MTLRAFTFLGFFLVLTGGPGAAQVMAPWHKAPVPFKPSPLLYVKLLGPEGMHMTVYQGRAPARDLPASDVIGVRPGYIYRIELNNMTRYPGVSLFPTLEVRGSLMLPSRINPRDFPAPIVVTDEDIRAVAEGSMITKVVYIEHPERSVPAVQQLDQPLEVTLDARANLEEEADERGRVMLIFRLGQKLFTREEMAAQSIPGTVLLPGDSAMSLPPVGPMIPWASWQWYDPKLGPAPFEEECIHNGGVTTSTGRWPLGSPPGMRPGLDPSGEVRGLQPENAVAVYSDSRGARHMTHSNRVCLCVPRFAIFRKELKLIAHNHAVGVTDAQRVLAQQQMSRRTPSLQAYQYDHLLAVKGRERATSTFVVEGLAPITQIQVLNASELEIGPARLLGTNRVNQLTDVERTLLYRQMQFALDINAESGVTEVRQAEGTAVVGRVDDGPEVIRATAQTRDFSCLCGEAPLPPDRPMTLCKWADRHSAKPGDVVTFYLKYTNHSGRAISDVAVMDSLSPRLEYIPGTSKADRDAVFTTQPNEADSLQLRWEITGKVQPGQSGVVSFQARVR